MTKFSAETVKTLTDEMAKLKVKFDRKAYRKSYDAIYFKKTVECPRCGQVKVKHMLNRHMKTKKCKRIANEKLFTETLGTFAFKG